MAGVGGSDVYRIHPGPVEGGRVATRRVFGTEIGREGLRPLRRTGADGYQLGILDAG
jgi:hypothetical protein